MLKGIDFRLVLFFLILFFSFQANAADLSKMAPDLREQLVRYFSSDEPGNLLDEAGTEDGDDVLLRKENGSDVTRLRCIIRCSDRSSLENVRSKVMEGNFITSNLRHLPFIAAKMSAADILRLSEEPAVTRISPDREVKFSSVPEWSFLQMTSGIDQVHPYTGEGIGIAVVDSGVYSASIDFMELQRSRIKLKKDFTDCAPQRKNDDYLGHGTHVAGIAAGNGAISKINGENLAGMAPGSDLLVYKVLTHEGTGYTSWLLEALDEILTDHSEYDIRVVNMSLSGAPGESYRTDPLCLAVKALVEEGIVVVCSAGNRGLNEQGEKIYGAIGNPGMSPYALTVGALNSYNTVIRSDDDPALFSSRGPTRGYDAEDGIYDNLIKPDISAPGAGLVSVFSPNNILYQTYPQILYELNNGNPIPKYMSLSGTSMAAPVVAGAVALLLEANPDLSPAMVKAILMFTAQLLPEISPYEQGAGALNIEGAIRLAERIWPDYENMGPGVNLCLDDEMPKIMTTTIAGETFEWAAGRVYAYRDGLFQLRGGALYVDDILLTDEGIFFVDGLNFSDGLLFCDLFAEGSSTAILWADSSCISVVPDNWDNGILSVEGNWEENAVLAHGDIIESQNLATEAILWSDGIFWADSTLAGAPALLWADGIIAAQSLLDELFVLNDNIAANGEFFDYE